MAKRKRPILYEVFGSETQVKGWGSAPKKRPKKAPRESRRSWGSGMKELRVSYELAAVIGLLTVVLGGTLYYFGWVRGNDPGSEASLASQAPSTSSGTRVPGEGTAAPPRGNPTRPPVSTAPRTETYATVRVFTASYQSGATAEQIRKQAKTAFLVKDFLIRGGHKDARAIRHAKSRSVVVYVGRAESTSELSGLVRRIRRLTLEGKKQFKSAYATQITVNVRE